MSTIMFVDHYAVLGVKRYASTKEINIAWKQFALKYHPDKCNGSNAIEEFLKGLEAAETLRDPQRREYYDKELKAYDLHYRRDWASRKRHPPRTSSAHASPLNPQSQYSCDPGDWTDPQRSWDQTCNRNDYHGPPPRYSEAQMDMIFETVKRRERERIAAEKQKAQQAEAEVKKHQREADQEMHAWETDNCLSGDLGAQKAQAQLHEEKVSARNVLDGAQSAAEFIETAEGRPLGQQMETLSNSNGPSDLEHAASHRSTVSMRASPSFHDMSGCNWRDWTLDSPTDWDDSSSDSDGGMLL